jgi:periplasmic divalent cation tolerance protein
MCTIIYSTIGTVGDAKKIAYSLVEEKLVACVNIIPNITSVYRWQGRIEEENESILIAKTTEVNVEKTIQKMQELHPYDLPDIIAISIIDGLEEYLNYIKDETK